jgi:hypothetical protein
MKKNTLHILSVKRMTAAAILALFLMATSTSCAKDKVEILPAPNCPDSLSFIDDVLPLIQDNCSACHSAGNGTGYTFTNHGNIAASADAILGSMRGEGYQLMPQGGPALHDSIVKKVECWIYQGKLNN